MSVRHSLSLHRFVGVRQAVSMLVPICILAAFAGPPGFDVTGRVTTAGGAPVPHAIVTARDLGRRITIAGTTDAAGRYRLDGLSEGTYRMAVYGDGTELAVRDSLRLGIGSVIDMQASTRVTQRARVSSEVLNLLPDGEEKRRFVLDCTGCHQLDERVAGLNGTSRSVDGWDEAITRMLRYAGATTGFPVISAHRDARSTAEWLSRHLASASTGPGEARPERQRGQSPIPARAIITEYELPLPQDLPHDVALTKGGRVVITGMMSHQMYVLDPATGSLETVAIPVQRANPRALEIDADGDWWVLLGAPMKLARYRPAGGAWTTWDIGVYPHSVALDRAGRAWFNGHFTRDPELIGFVSPADSTVTQVALPSHPTMASGPGGPIPYELRVAPDGRVWTSELLGNRLIAHTPGTTQFEVFEMPLPHSGPRRFDFDARGTAWIPAYAANALVRLDPATRAFRTHPLPVADAVPYVVRVDTLRGRIWVGTSAADAVFAFDPENGRWATYPLPSRGALVRHMAVDPESGDVWLAYGASPGIPARVARLSPR